LRLSRQRERVRGPKNDHEARILAAAAEVFLERGFEETSTAEIARRAKVSKRELYSNFRDKRDMLGAVITQLQSNIQAQADVSWSSRDDLRKVLIDAGTGILTFINSERFGKLFRIVAAESFRDPVLARKFYTLGPGAGRDRTASFLRRHMKAGNLRKVDPFRAADDFLDLVISALHLTAVVLGQNDATPQPRKHVGHAVDLFLRYYGAQTNSQMEEASATAQGNGPSRVWKHDLVSRPRQ
jgi:TetR/AcrR family transcriptional regulator, mexJK operon transcriptional repressor